MACVVSLSYRGEGNVHRVRRNRLWFVLAVCRTEVEGCAGEAIDVQLRPIQSQEPCQLCIENRHLILGCVRCLCGWLVC